MVNKAFIFDWSGTLSDNFHLFCKVCDLMFTELGKEPISADEIKLNFTLPYMRFWNRYFPELTKETQCSLYEKYINQVGEPEIYKNVAEVIKYLSHSGHQLFILSSDPISKLLPEIERFGFSQLITKIVGGVHHKDEAIVTLINDFTLDKKRTFYVGDTTGDIEAGKSAGVTTIGISWGYNHKEVLAAAKPDFLIDDIEEITIIC
jgi:phosphoglycolate phosphatase-like HAD superfamily hydrolase